MLSLRGQALQALQLLPGAMVSADVSALAAGQGLLTCSTQTHQATGARPDGSGYPASRLAPVLGAAAAKAAPVVQRLSARLLRL